VRCGIVQATAWMKASSNLSAMRDMTIPCLTTVKQKMGVSPTTFQWEGCGGRRRRIQASCCKPPHLIGFKIESGMV
jgi:hypothetical protein